MQKLVLYIGLFISLNFSQTFDPNTGEIIKPDTTNIQFDPKTGEIINTGNYVSRSNNNYKYKSQLSPKSIKNIARIDVYDNFNLSTTWSVLGGGISIVGIFPFFLPGIALESPPVLLAGIGLGFYGLPKLLAKMDSQPSKLVQQKTKFTTLSPEQKLIYKDAYSNELQQKRIKAIKKGRVGWVIGGFSCMAFLAMIFG